MTDQTVSKVVCHLPWMSRKLTDEIKDNRKQDFEELLAPYIPGKSRLHFLLFDDIFEMSFYFEGTEGKQSTKTYYQKLHVKLTRSVENDYLVIGCKTPIISSCDFFNHSYFSICNVNCLV